MDHSQAIETQAAERYLLGELSASEAEDFEQHYFECTDCAEAVESGGAFIANARAVLGRPSRPAPASPPVPRTPFRFLFLQPQWAFALASAAAVAFAGIALYQGAIVIPRLEHLLENPVILPAIQLAGASRGEAAPMRVPRRAPFVPLSADIPPDVRSSQYRCVLTRAGQNVFTVTGPAPAGAQPITVLVPAAKLSSGDYELTIFGENGLENGKITTYLFHFEFY
jgi:anti-sigma factor RsiW